MRTGRLACVGPAAGLLAHLERHADAHLVSRGEGLGPGPWLVMLFHRLFSASEPWRVPWPLLDRSCPCLPPSHRRYPAGSALHQRDLLAAPPPRPPRPVRNSHAPPCHRVSLLTVRTLRYWSFQHVYGPAPSCRPLTLQVCPGRHRCGHLVLVTAVPRTQKSMGKSVGMQ